MSCGNAVSAGCARTVLVLSGTCSSGKSHVSFELESNHSYVQIDGDWVWTMLKSETGKKIAADAIHMDLLKMAYGVASMGHHAVVAHVTRPQEFELYRQFLAERGISMCGVVLQPSSVSRLPSGGSGCLWPCG